MVDEERGRGLDAEERHIDVLDGHQATRTHHTTQLAEEGGHGRVREVLHDVGTPDGIEGSVRERQPLQRSHLESDGAPQRRDLQASLERSDVGGGCVQGHETAVRPDELSEKWQEASAAAARVQDAPAGLHAHHAQHGFVLWPAGLEVDVQPLRRAQALAGGRDE